MAKPKTSKPVKPAVAPRRASKTAAAAASKSAPPAPPPSPERTATTAYDAARGRAAFRKLETRLAALASDRFATTTVDVGAAALTALGVAEYVSTPEVRQRFAGLPRDAFDIACLDDLATAAWAAWYAHDEATKVRARATDARLPAALVQTASDLKSRMQPCCEYHFADDAELGPEIARLRAGSGHRDLATDLLGYAAIYDARAALLQHDRKHYRPTDAASAIATAEEMLRLLGAALSPEARAAAERLARAWTFLLENYNEVADTGRWLYRKTADHKRRFPSLFSIGRGNETRKPRKKDPAAPPAPPKG